jgi:alpha-ketoglutarate-dependent taurine dioxygenase
MSHSWQPLLLTPDGVAAAASPAGLCGYLDDSKLIDDLLVEHNALVLRGFGVTAGTLDGVLDRILPNRLAYVQGNSPRTKVGQNVYTSTEYPAEYTISMHNELSYAHRWPARLAFFCERAAETGGATTLVDGARWLESLEDRVRRAFAGGVRYSQNLHGGYGLGKSWQDTFETDQRDEVERFLADTGATWRWGSDNELFVSQVRPATVHHPVNGVEVWFNQADQWHPASLGDEATAELAQVLPAEEMPQSVTFADGSPIPAEFVNQVRDRGLAEAVDVAWLAGDVLLIDNVLVAHGRRPFTGQRRVLVAMSD